MKAAKLAVFGNPISHSLSPILHAVFAQQAGIQIDYQKILVPHGEFKKTVDAFRISGAAGANITAPFKFEACNYCDALTDRAAKTKTVNTFIFKDNICLGDNTDGIGLIRDLQKKSIRCADKTILILGAGGATQAILSELISQGPRKIIILNRSIEKAKALIEFFHHPNLVCVDDIGECVNEIDLLINATSIDFHHHAPFDINLSSAVCYDLNYGERHYAFSQWVKKNNASYVYDGLGMLIEQGAESFKQWLALINA